MIQMERNCVAYKRDSLVIKGNGFVYQYLKEKYNLTDDDFVTELV